MIRHLVLLVYTVLPQVIKARLNATPVDQHEVAAGDKAAFVRLQVDGDDAMVLNHMDNDMSNASRLNLPRADPALAMGLPASAVSLGVQEAERHQIRAEAKPHEVGSNMPVGHLPSGGPYYSLKSLGDAVGSGKSRMEAPQEVNRSEQVYAVMMEWKLVAVVLLGCVLVTFLLGPIFGCLGMLLDISFMSLLLTRAGYGKETERPTERPTEHPTDGEDA